MGPSLLLAVSLAWASAVDIHRFIIPNLISIGLVIAGLAGRLSAGFVEAIPYIAGAAAGYGVLLVVAAVYRRRLGRTGLGMGDAKLFAAAGAWLGWVALPSVMLVASFVALGFVGLRFAMSRKLDLQRPIPFGPFIALGFWVVWLAGPLVG